MRYKYDFVPRGFRLTGPTSNGLQMGGSAIFGGRNAIFLECRFPNRTKCHDTISLVPNMEHSISEITDELAGKIFANNGWLVKGYNNKKYSRCPYCIKQMS